MRCVKSEGGYGGGYDGGNAESVSRINAVPSVSSVPSIEKRIWGREGGKVRARRGGGGYSAPVPRLLITPASWLAPDFAGGTAPPAPATRPHRPPALPARPETIGAQWTRRCRSGVRTLAGTSRSHPGSHGARWVSRRQLHRHPSAVRVRPASGGGLVRHAGQFLGDAVQLGVHQVRRHRLAGRPGVPGVHRGHVFGHKVGNRAGQRDAGERLGSGERAALGR